MQRYGKQPVVVRNLTQRWRGVHLLAGRRVLQRPRLRWCDTKESICLCFDCCCCCCSSHCSFCCAVLTTTTTTTAGSTTRTTTRTTTPTTTSPWLITFTQGTQAPCKSVRARAGPLARLKISPTPPHSLPVYVDCGVHHDNDKRRHHHQLRGAWLLCCAHQHSSRDHRSVSLLHAKAATTRADTHITLCTLQPAEPKPPGHHRSHGVLVPQSPAEPVSERVKEIA
jgi:hypothetical protein